MRCADEMGCDFCVFVEKEYGMAGHAGSKLDKKVRITSTLQTGKENRKKKRKKLTSKILNWTQVEDFDKRLRSKGNALSQYSREELDAINKHKDEASRSINERIEGVDRRFEKKASEAKHGVLSWFGWD